MSWQVTADPNRRHQSKAMQPCPMVGWTVTEGNSDELLGGMWFEAL
jgi:hypothetical protein